MDAEGQKAESNFLAVPRHLDELRRAFQSLLLVSAPRLVSKK